MIYDLICINRYEILSIMITFLPGATSIETIHVNRQKIYQQLVKSSSILDGILKTAKAFSDPESNKNKVEYSHGDL